jgi:hypothetical protein
MSGEHLTADPRYPIGPFQTPESFTADDRSKWIAEIIQCPARMREAVAGLSEAQLDTPYREGGWTVRQLVHHVPDSHLNAYTFDEEPLRRRRSWIVTLL